MLIWGWGETGHVSGPPQGRAAKPVRVSEAERPAKGRLGRPHRERVRGDDRGSRTRRVVGGGEATRQVAPQGGEGELRCEKCRRKVPVSRNDWVPVLRNIPGRAVDDPRITVLRYKKCGGVLYVLWTRVVEGRYWFS